MISGFSCPSKGTVGRLSVPISRVRADVKIKHRI